MNITRHRPASHPVLRAMSPAARGRLDAAFDSARVQRSAEVSGRIERIGRDLSALPDVALTVEQTRLMGAIADEVMRRVAKAAA